MGGEKQAEINAALLTAGYIINTTLGIEDVNESLNIYSRFKKECEKLAKSSADLDLIKDVDLISNILTASYIMNTRPHTENMDETLAVLNKMRDVVVQIIKKVPHTFEEKSDQNIVAAIIVAGLIVNTVKWEEDILETGVLLKACKEGLLKLRG